MWQHVGHVSLLAISFEDSWHSVRALEWLVTVRSLVQSVAEFLERDVWDKGWFDV